MSPAFSLVRRPAANLALLACLFAFWCAGTSPVQAQATYSYPSAGFTYTQNFGSLVYQSGTSANTNNPITLNGVTYTLPPANTPFSLTDTTIGSGGNALGPGMAGWWALCLGTSNRYGANQGDQTTGGLVSYGGISSSTRALGLIATSSSGIDEAGMCLINNTGGNLNSLTISFSGELWRQTNTPKSLQFDYYLSSSGTSSLGTAVSSGIAVSALGVSYGTGSTANGSNSGPVTSSLISDTFGLNSTWAQGQALWITWEMPSAAGSGQGYGIGNLNFSATETTSGPSTDTWNTTSGTWNTTAANWSGPANNKYTDGDNVIFGNISTSSTVTVAPSAVNPGSVTISNSANTYTFTGQPIGGSGAVAMSGTGGMAILAMANSYSGGTTLSGGTLVAAAGDASLGAASGAVNISNGATFRVANQPFASGRAFTIGAGGAVFDTNSLAPSTSGAVAVNGPLTVVGGGTLALNGALTSTSTAAPTTIASGTFLAVGGPAGGPANVEQSFLNSGGTFNGNLVVNAPVRVDFSNGTYGGAGEVQLAYSGTINGDGSDGTSLWTTLAAFSGATGGTLATNLHLNPARLPHTQADVTQQTFTLNTANPFVVSLGTQKGTVWGVSGNIYGSADVILGSNDSAGSGNGTVVLAGSNTYTGTTIMAGKGAVILGSSTALPSTTDVVFNFPFSGTKDPTLDLGGFSQQINSLESIPQGALNGEASATAGTFGITNNGSTPATLTISGATTPYYPYGGQLRDGNSTLGLVKGGPSLLVLSGTANTYSNGTTVTGGTLEVSGGSGTTLGTGAIDIRNGATLASSGNAYVATANNLVTIESGATLTPGGIGALGSFNFDSLGGLTLVAGSTTDFYHQGANSDSIIGHGNLTLPASGRVTINLDNPAGLGGTFPLFGFDNVYDSSGSTIGTGANLFQYLSLTGTNARQMYSLSLTNTGSTYADQINLTISGTASSNDVWAVNSGSWDLTSTTNWTGGAPVAGQYKDYDNVTFGNITASSTVSVAAGGVNPSSMAVTNSTGNSYTFAGGPIGGDGAAALSVSGGGMVILASSNSYTGGTSVSGGTLVVQGGDNRLGAPSSGVTLDSGAVLQTANSGLISSRSFSTGPNGGVFDTLGFSSTLSGGLTLNGNLTKVNGGTLTESGPTTFNSTSNPVSLNVNGGVMALDGAVNFGTQGAVNIQSGATLVLGQVNGTVDMMSGGTVNGNLILANSGARFNFDSGTVQGSGTISVPTASIRITNANSATGGVVAVPIVLNSNNLPFAPVDVTQASISTSGTNRFISTIGGTKNASGTSASVLEIDGVISGNSDVNFSNSQGGGGSGNLTLGASNTYTGTTMIDFAGNSNAGSPGGQVVLKVTNALPIHTDVIFGAIGNSSTSATLDLSGNSQQVGSISVAGGVNGSGFNITDNSGSPSTLTICGTNSPAYAYTGYISDGTTYPSGATGVLSLVKAGPNTITLAISGPGSSDYSGGTTVEAGALYVSSNSGQTVTGYGDVNVTGGTFGGNAIVGLGSGNLNIYAGGSVAGGLPGQPGTLTVSNTATLYAGAKADFSFSAVSAGQLSVGVLTLPGSGSVAVNLSNLGGLSGNLPLFTYGSLTNAFSAGQLAIGAAPDPASHYTFLNNSGTISVVAPYLLTWSGTGGSNVWDTADKPNFNAVNGTGGLMAFNSLTSAAANPYGVANAVAYDHVTFDDTGSGGIVQINGSVEPESLLFNNNSKSYTFTGGSIIGSTSLVLSGTGTVVLDNSNTYSGGTYVNSGELVAMNGESIADGSNLYVGTAVSDFGGVISAGNESFSLAVATAVPEPGTLALLAAGAVLAGCRTLRRKS